MADRHVPTPDDAGPTVLLDAPLSDLTRVHAMARGLASAVGHLVQATRSAQANPNSAPARGWLDTCYAQYLSARADMDAAYARVRL